MDHTTILAHLDRCIASPSAACTMLSSARLCRKHASEATSPEDIGYWALKCVAYTHSILSHEYDRLARPHLYWADGTRKLPEAGLKVNVMQPGT